MDYPKTKTEWWDWVDEHQDDLINCVRQFHPNSKTDYHPSREFMITASNAEAACERVRQTIAKNNVSDPVLLAKMYILDRDPQLARVLNETWFGAPESTDVFHVPGFGVLCDLCSESYLLYDKEDEDVDSA